MYKCIEKMKFLIEIFCLCRTLLLPLHPYSNIRYGKEKYDTKDQRRDFQRKSRQLSGLLQHNLSYP